MASTTVTTPQPRTRPSWRRLTRVRAALAPRVRQAAAVTSAARHRYRRPALVTSSFTSIDVSAWHTFGLGAGLLVLGLLMLVFEWIGSDE